MISILKVGIQNLPVSDAIVSAMQYCPLRTLLHMQSCPGLCKNLPVAMYMNVRAYSERTCTEPTYMQHEYSRMIAAKTQRPHISNVIHDMQGRFLHGADTTAYANVMQQRPGAHKCICICKTVRRTLLHMQ